MISAKRLVAMTKDFVAKKKRSVSRPFGTSTSTTTTGAKREHVVVYSSDGKRFELALKYMGSLVILELVRMSTEMEAVDGENGTTIRLACDSSILDYIISFFDMHDGYVDEDTQKALLSIFVSNIGPTLSNTSPPSSTITSS